MKVRGWSAAVVVGLSLLPSIAAQGQPPTTAKIESIPLELKSPDRYQIHAVLEPIRHVTITAPNDGILRTLEVPVGAAVRERQEIGQLDRAEALARLKIAQANVKEAEAALKFSGAAPAGHAQLEAQVEAAQARAELAQLELDRCTLRAPFGGTLLGVAVSPGQFLPKGAKIADLADVSSLRVLVPFDRSTVTAGASVPISVEGQAVHGKVQATLPLPESLAGLRELATAFTAAWVIVPNPKGELEPGQRVLSPSLPTSPLATIPSRALREPEKGETGGPSVQVIRNEYVTDIPVRVLGHPGPERVQVSGLLRPNDALVVSSSVRLVAGTLIRFSGTSNSAGGIEPTNPNPAEGGEVAGITPPRSAGTRVPPGPSTRGRTTTSSSNTALPRTPATRPPASTPPASTKGAAPPPF